MIFGFPPDFWISAGIRWISAGILDFRRNPPDQSPRRTKALDGPRPQTDQGPRRTKNSRRTTSLDGPRPQTDQALDGPRP